MLLLIFLVHRAFSNPCDPGWTFFQDNCYKHIVRENDTRVIYDEAVSDCAEKDSYLAPAASQEEWDFIIQLGTRPGNWSVTVDALTEFSPSPELSIGGGDPYMDYLLLGATRPSGGYYYWLNSDSEWFGEWCKSNEPSYGGNYCITMQFDPICIWDVNCDNDYRSRNFYPNKFLHYICKKSRCLEEGAELKADGTCDCKEEYLDIVDLNIPEGKLYQKGEKCIPRYPCQNLTDLSIAFVVDSSESIGESNWENMVTFLQSGSHLLNNTVNVGFIKFSTVVSATEWLPKFWTKEQYVSGTPSVFDAGDTDTSAALDAARELFKDVTSNNRAVVLITHSMPYVSTWDGSDAVNLETTFEAAKELRREKIDLVILGYGEELRNHIADLKKPLSNPRTDYFQFDGEAGDLKEMHMSYLLDKVCKRFK